jgi:NAD(P)-dependent dehydrogenase (short-subunit alcohol dehydrogenase family)
LIRRLNDKGKRGSLIFTSATAAWRGNKTTAAFSSGKTGQRALAQSLNKEFGPQNIHVCSDRALVIFDN